MFKSLLLIAAAGLFAGASLTAQETGYLKTKIEPGRAGIFVDGKYVGPAANFGSSRKYALAPGKHEIKLVEPRYEEITTSVTIEKGKTANLTQTMKAIPEPKGPFGVLRTKSPDKFAAVYVNDRFCGHADEFDNYWQGMKLPAGEYTIRIEPTNGSGNVTKKVTIVANKTIIVQ
ncbi:MAG TPA: PEGA domain-containing protein [Candidatus Sulfopaludibacter sp.]|jgi:hypothetical protein|nr:PEGA domain-containing protein [Candidatus Sulfopaludibacter sp.]